MSADLGPSDDALDHVEPKQPINAEEAIAILKEGNARFVSGKLSHPHEDKGWRKEIAKGQHPFATVLGCSDSRVTPELIFDEGLGDLFVIRVAGNIVDEDVTGSIEYAVQHLDTHLVIVLGHENCGAVTAAMASAAAETKGAHLHEPHELGSLVHRLKCAICEHHDGEPDVDGDTDLSLAVRKNVMCSVRQLRECRDMGVCLADHNVKVVGAIYDMESGSVQWLE